MRFELSDNEALQVSRWLHYEVYPDVIEHQMANTLHPTPFHYDCWELGFPYTGATGGGVTYCFSPTSLGMVKKVVYNAHIQYELDLTDYDSW